jgi:uncharacterized protein
MNPMELFDAYYPAGTELRRILEAHSRDVAGKALSIARRHPEMNLDIPFIEEAAMLHDIGIFLCDAPDIHCHGTYDYICHGYLGADIVRKAGYPRHALVCERHTGTGLSLSSIIERGLPLPHRDMQPVSPEEQIICFADKFFSKLRLGEEKPLDRILHSLSRHGADSVDRFEKWSKLFL